MTDGNPATIVLVHGAWCGPWVAWKLGPALSERGVPFVLADLPSCAATDTSVDVRDDIDHVRGLIDSVDGPSVVVGKSYGGIVISGAALDRPNVRHLVYVAAMLPEAGSTVQQTTSGALTPEFSAGIGFTEHGLLTMDPEIGARHGFSKATEEERDVWRREQRPMSMGNDPNLTLDRVAWTSVPSTYVVCEEDEAIRPDKQRGWAERTTNAISGPFDHTPGVSAPDAIADLLESIARSR